jgi:hypothetical protein
MPISDKLAADALARINELKAENEGLRSQISKAAGKPAASGSSDGAVTELTKKNSVAGAIASALVKPASARYGGDVDLPDVKKSTKTSDIHDLTARVRALKS